MFRGRRGNPYENIRDRSTGMHMFVLNYLSLGAGAPPSKPACNSRICKARPQCGMGQGT